MPSGGVHTITHCGPSAVSGWPGEIGRSSPSFADGLQLSSERRRAAYDVWPVTAATMIRGIALTSAAATASATIALNSGVPVKGEAAPTVEGKSAASDHQPRVGRAING